MSKPKIVYETRVQIHPWCPKQGTTDCAICERPKGMHLNEWIVSADGASGYSQPINQEQK